MVVLLFEMENQSSPERHARRKGNRKKKSKKKKAESNVRRGAARSRYPAKNAVIDVAGDASAITSPGSNVDIVDLNETRIVDVVGDDSPQSFTGSSKHMLPADESPSFSSSPEDELHISVGAHVPTPPPTTHSFRSEVLVGGKVDVGILGGAFDTPSSSIFNGASPVADVPSPYVDMSFNDSPASSKASESDMSAADRLRSQAAEAAQISYSLHPQAHSPINIK